MPYKRKRDSREGAAEAREKGKKQQQKERRSPAKYQRWKNSYDHLREIRRRYPFCHYLKTNGKKNKHKPDAETEKSYGGAV